MKKTRHMRVLAAICAIVVALVAGLPEAGLGAVVLMGQVDTVDLNNAMKIIFEDSIVNNVVTDTELLDLFEEDNRIMREETTGGRYIETAQYFGLPAGVGARHENDYIPVPNGPSIENSRIYLKKIQGVVDMTGDVMKRVRSSEGAFLNWADRALPDLVTRLRHELDRMLLSYGAGIKARVNDGAPDATLGIDSAFGLAGLTNQHLQFLEGESVVFSTNATGDPLRDTGTSAEVEDINDAGTEITLDALPAGVVDDDYIFPGDDSGFSGQGSSGSDREPMGLLGMVDDGSVLATFQNIVRADWKLWRSIVEDAGAVGLNEELITEVDDRVFVEGGGRGDVFVTSRTQIREYWKDLKQDRTLNDPRSYTGGKGDEVGIFLGDRTVRLRVARKMPPELAFLLQTDTFKRWQLGTFEWDDTTGAIWRQVTDATGRKDAFYAYGNMYLQMGCLHPRKNAKIENLGTT